MALKTATRSDGFRRNAENKTKRSRTLARLMDAAVSLFAERGVEATTVLDITTAAGLANGTFYSYFKDKPEIIVAVYEGVTDALVSNIISNLDAIDDGPSQVALGSIWFTEAVSREPHWGWMIVKALEGPSPFREMSGATIARYIENGARQGRFKIEVTPALMDLMLAVLIGAIRSRLERPGVETEQVGMLAAEMHLRMLGMTPDQALSIPSHAKKVYGDRPESRAPEIVPGSPRHVPLRKSNRGALPKSR